MSLFSARFNITSPSATNCRNLRSPVFQSDEDVEQVQGFTINIILEHGSPKYRSNSIDKILNGMILFKFLRFPLNDCGYYEKYESFSDINRTWDKKRHLKRKRWSQE